MISIQKKEGLIKYIFEALICLFYVWFFLPIVNANLKGSIYNLFFFACLFIGMVGLIILNGIKTSRLFWTVIIYYIAFFIMYFLDVGEIKKTIRINLIFFGMSIIYFGILDEGGKVRISKFLILMFIITCITSSIGVLTDNAAARTLTDASADDKAQLSFKLKNISSIYIFQGMVMLIPLLVILPQKRTSKFISAILLILLLFIIINASFTISLLLYVATLVLSLFVKNVKKKTIEGLLIAILAVGITFLCVMFGEQIFTFVGNLLADNEKISTRLFELRDMIYYGSSYGDAGIRSKLYLASFETFLNNPFGVGAFYSYNVFENGIGYHSQILDDLARFGLFAVIFYFFFITSYYKFLKKEYDKIGCGYIAFLVCLIYVAFLMLNIGFRSAEESIVVFCIIPSLPNLIVHYRNKKNKS